MPIPGKPSRAKARVELEKLFLCSLMAKLDDGDIREAVAKYRACWRFFRDKRHRAIWRAFEALNLKSVDERMDMLIGEEDGSDAGDPGSAAWKHAQKKLIDNSRGLAWLERELGEAGLLPLAGGKKYLREIAGAQEREQQRIWNELEKWKPPESADELARRLGFM